AILGIARARTAPARTVPARTVPDSHTSPSRSCLSRTAAARGAPSGERGLVILALRKLHRQPTGVPLYAVTALWEAVHYERGEERRTPGVRKRYEAAREHIPRAQMCPLSARHPERSSFCR